MNLFKKGEQPTRTEYAPDQQTLDSLKADDSIAFNALAEQEFCAFVCKLLDEIQRATKAEVIQEASYELNISPVTAKRYLTKHTARRARFVIVNGIVRCKEHEHRGIRVVKGPGSGG